MGGVVFYTAGEGQELVSTIDLVLGDFEHSTLNSIIIYPIKPSKQYFWNIGDGLRPKLASLVCT